MSIADNCVYSFIFPPSRVETMEDFAQRDGINVSAEKLCREAAAVAAPLFNYLSKQYSATTVDFFANRIVLHFDGTDETVRGMAPRDLPEEQTAQFSQIISWISRYVLLLQRTKEPLPESDTGSTDLTEVKRSYSAGQLGDVGLSSGERGYFPSEDRRNRPVEESNGSIDTIQEVEKCEQLSAEIEKLKKKRRGLESQLAEAHTNLEASEQQKQAQLKQHVDDLHALDEAKRERETLGKHVMQLQFEKQGVEASLKEAKERHASLESRFNEAQQSVKDVEKALVQKDQRLNKLKVERLEIEEALTQKDRQLRELKAENREVSLQKEEENQRLLDQVARMRGDFKRAVQEKASIQENLLEKEEQLARWEQGYSKDIEEKAALRTEISELKKTLREQQEQFLTEKRLLRKKRQQLAESFGQLDHKRTEESSMGESRGTIDTTQEVERRERLSAEIEKLKEGREDLKVQLAEARTNVAELARLLAASEQQKQAQLEQRTGDLSALDAAKRERELLNRHVTQLQFEKQNSEVNLEEAKERYASLTSLYNLAIQCLEEMEEELNQKNQQLSTLKAERLGADQTFLQKEEENQRLLDQIVSVREDLTRSLEEQSTQIRRLKCGQEQEANQKQRIDALEKMCMAIRESLAELHSLLQTPQGEYDSHGELCATAETLQSQPGDYEERMKTLEEKKEQIQQELQQRRERIGTLNDKVQGLENTIEEQKKQFTELQLQLNAQEQRPSLTEADMQKQETIEQLQGKAVEWEMFIGSLEDQLDGLFTLLDIQQSDSTKIGRRETGLSLRERRGNCALLLDKAMQKIGQIRRIEQDKEMWEKEIHSLQATMKDASKAIVEYEKQIQELDRENADLCKLSEKLEKTLKQQTQNVEEESRSLKDDEQDIEVEEKSERVRTPSPSPAVEKSETQNRDEEEVRELLRTKETQQEEIKILTQQLKKMEKCLQDLSQDNEGLEKARRDDQQKWNELKSRLDRDMRNLEDQLLQAQQDLEEARLQEQEEMQSQQAQINEQKKMLCSQLIALLASLEEINAQFVRLGILSSTEDVGVDRLEEGDRLEQLITRLSNMPAALKQQKISLVARASSPSSSSDSGSSDSGLEETNLDLDEDHNLMRNDSFCVKNP